MFTNYEGAKVVVTGAGNGIGKQIAKEFAKRGSDVACIDIHGEDAEKTAEEIRGMGADAFAVQADVSRLEECRGILEEVLKHFGRVDVLVDDAGVSALSDITKIPERDIRWVYEVNVFSHWFMMQTFIPQMRAQKTHGQIINVCSIAGLINMGAAPAYFSSKHAAVSLSECTWKWLRSQKIDIDVSVFCPGYVHTDMHLTDRHRPERFAIPENDEYYKSEEYQKMVAFNKSLLDNAESVEDAVHNIFEALKKEQFYIFNTTQYDRLLCEQGVFQVEKTRPVDYYELN